MDWKYYIPKFEYEEKFADAGWPWAGHKYFAYDLVANIKPKRIVELGTHYGTSLWSFSQAAKDQQIDAEIFAVDTWKGEKHSGLYGEEVFKTVNGIKNNYYQKLKINLIRKTFDEAVLGFKDRSIDILHIDGLHTYEGVKHDYENWKNKVKSNGIVLFHDIFVKEDDFGVYKFWDELKKNHSTIEFHHSYGLGVLFLDDKIGSEFNKIAKELQMHYAYLHGMRQYEEIQNLSSTVAADKEELKKRANSCRYEIREATVELGKKLKEKKEKILAMEKVAQKKDQEIEFMKSSKFWKMREFNFKIKFAISHPAKFITKYFKKIKILYRDAVVSFSQEGPKRMALRSMNYLLHGKGVLNKKELVNRRRYAAGADQQDSFVRDVSAISPFNNVFYISNILGGGAKKYISDLTEAFETSRLNFVQIRNRDDLNAYKNLFKKDDILLFQYLYDSDLTFEDIVYVKKRYEIKLVIPIHDFYFLQKLTADFYRCHNGIYASYNNKGPLMPSVLSLLKAADVIIYPSNYVKNIFDSIFVFDNAKLSRHIDYKVCDFLSIPKVENTINIGIINNITVYKGADYYSKLFSVESHKGYDIQYHIFGTNKIESPNVVFHGSYIEGEIFSLLKKSNIHGLVFLNKWGETYSYSLTKGINSGLPILFSNIGAYVERLQNRQKYFSIQDMRNIEADLQKMLDMIIEKQGTTPKDEISQFEKDIPDLYKDLFSRKNIDDHPTRKKSKVSVVVPNYNYENFLTERLNSIIRQTYKPFEIIFLDDNSQDKSVELAKKILLDSDISYKIITNKINEGCFAQWAKGVRETKGDLVWIAEADDSCDPNFLETLVAKFSDPEVGLAYAQSVRIDEHGKKGNTYLPYLETIPSPENRWRNDYVNNGLNEIRNYLVIKNTIINASAVLMRRDLLLQLGDNIGGGYKQAGDWFTYIKILEKSKIAFAVSPLNFWRSHQNNIVSRGGANSEERSKQLVSESLDIQNLILSQLSVSDRRSALAWEHSKLVCRNNLNKEIESFPEYAEKSKIFKKKNDSLRKKILFFSTNDGWGGSEIACAKIAQAFSDKDFSVALCMKKHNPQPEILKKIISENRIALLERTKIADSCKSENVRAFVKNFAPDLIFISQGHVFEGGEMMEWCQSNGFDYVNFIPLITKQHLQIISPDENSIIRNEKYLQLSKMIFSDNSPAKGVMEKLFDMPVENFSVIRNGFDVPYNQIPTWEDSSDGVYNLIYIGRLYYIHKGLDMLLEVLAMKKWKDRPLQIMAYGEGSDRNKMEEYIKEHDIKNFHFCGYTEDLATEITKCHGSIFPSRMEGTPIALIDALLCYRMGIVTPVGGMTEFVKDGKTGFVADEPTTKALDECMEKAWERRNDWQKIGEEAGKEARKLVPEFPQQQCIDEIDKILS
jgi:glycosyltransferase involved in cell wall biosynthesis